MLRPETIRRHIDEAECDFCGCPLLVGDRAFVDLGQGAIYCCRSCGERDAAERAPVSGSETTNGPAWQGQLYPGLYPELLADQGELFPGHGEDKKKPRVPDLPGQGHLFE